MQRVKEFFEDIDRSWRLQASQPIELSLIGSAALMVLADRVPHALLVQRFRSAADDFAFDARVDQLPKYLANLHQVERDYLGVAPSDIELPEWH